MFGNNKNLEREISTLREKNVQLVKAIEEMGKSHSTDFVIKLIPECSDSFYLNGEFVSDQSRAVYGSHCLSFSEAVCWKAGKEVAKRAYESIISDAEKNARTYSSLSTSSSDKVQAIQEELDDVKREYASDLEILKGFREQHNVMKDRIEALQEDNDSLRCKIKSLESSCDEFRNKYIAAKEQLARLTVFEPSGTIFTSCGAVVSNT